MRRKTVAATAVVVCQSFNHGTRRARRRCDAYRMASCDRSGKPHRRNRLRSHYLMFYELLLSAPPGELLIADCPRLRGRCQSRETKPRVSDSRGIG